MPKTCSIPYSYVDHLQHTHFKKEEIDLPDLQLLLNQFGQISPLAPGIMPAFYIIDYSKQDYILMSEGIRQFTDFRPEDFMDSGLSMLLDIYNKDDFKVYNEKVFAANKKFLQCVPQEEHQQHVFNYTFRVKDGRGSMSHIWQRGMYITDSEKQPVYSLGTAIEVTGMCNPNVIFHSIERITNTRQVVQQNNFYVYEEDASFTQREKDIVRFIAEGLSIKQIADKLHITENTIANHRKNMFRKTNTKNMAELVAQAIRKRII